MAQEADICSANLSASQFNSQS